MKGALLISFFLTATVIFGQTTKLNLASDVWPPFTDISSERAFALDLVSEALSRTSVEMYSEILDFEEVMQGIVDKTFDGSAALWYSPERAEFLLYSDPYLENRLILVGKKGSNVTAHALSALMGKKIGVVESYAYGSLLDDIGTNELVMGKSDQQNLERLLKGEVDYFLADALLVEYLLEYQSQEADKYLEIGSATLLTLPLYFAIRKDIPDAERIIEAFNAEIMAMIADGSYNRILQLNWVSTDIDGDGIPELVLNGNKAGLEAPSNSYTVKSNASATAENSSSYMIEGNKYPSWESVPKKYKVSQVEVTGGNPAGFGPVFKF